MRVVGNYATRDGAVQIEVLESVDCDQARFIFARALGYSLSSRDSTGDSVSIALLACESDFVSTDFLLVEGDGWCALLNLALLRDDEAENTDGIKMVIDRESQLAFADVDQCRGPVREAVVAMAMRAKSPDGSM